jgi:sugar-specific transcriptional regulator TrmB
VAIDYKASSELSRQALVQAGLTEGQSSIYEALIHYGPQKATKLAFLAGVSRTLSYKMLDELEGLGLVSKKDEPGRVAVFTPAHPLKLKELADKRLEEAKDAKVALDGALSKLISDFNTVSGAPGIRILEGVAGFAELLEDQLNEQQPIFILRSPLYAEHPELSQVIKKHLEDRTKLLIPVRSIEAFAPRALERIQIDAQNKVERRFIPADSLSIPADVVIYANKVAINAYQTPLMTTLIENTAIHSTFKLLFEYIWAKAEPEHAKIMDGIVFSSE